MTTLAFPDTKTGERTTRTLSITNATGGPISVWSDTLPDPWKISKDGVVFVSKLEGQIIQDGESHTLTIAMSSNETGSYSHTITIHKTGSDETHTLEGDVIDGSVSVPTDISYATSIEKGTSEKIGEYIITNNTTKNIKTSQMTLPTGFTDGTNSYFPSVEIAAGASHTFELYGTPSTPGDYMMSTSLEYLTYEIIMASDGALIDSDGITIIE